MTPATKDTMRPVVIIEDDPTLSEVIAELLADEGYPTFRHSSADGALEVVRQSAASLVLLDVRLGGRETGWRVLDELVLDPETRSVPVVVMSGAIDSLEAHRMAISEKYGVWMLPKPFGLEQLLSTLEFALDSRSLEASLGSENQASVLPG